MIKRRCTPTALLLLAGTLAFCSCSTPRQTGPVKESDYAEPIRVACVGDSITYGSGISDREHNSYPAQLGRLLGNHWEVRNFGVSGATLLKQGDRPYWKQRAYQAALDFEPDVVIIKLGTNDSKPQNWAHQQEFMADYVALIQSFEALESKPRIWLCLPVPAFPDNWGITETVIAEEVIPQVKLVAVQTGLPVIDLHTALDGHPDLFPDKIHPNAQGAGIMAETIYAAVTDKVPAAN